MAFQSDFSNGTSKGTSIIPASVDENRVSPTENSAIFPRGSAIWRIAREQVLLLGGPAAAILQVAHPEVAHGVAHHSDFRHDTLGRLHRTLEAVYTITFAPRAEVEAIAARVRASHVRVRGDSPQAYSAFSPDAQMWVLATLIQTSVEMYERFVAPLDDASREGYFRDMRTFGVWFGLDRGHGPQTWPDFCQYYQDMLNRPALASLPISRELARHIARPEKPFILRTLWPFSGTVACEFLPSPVREKLGLHRTGATAILAATMDAVLPALLPGLPDQLRFTARYLQAVNERPAPAGAG